MPSLDPPLNGRRSLAVATRYPRTGSSLYRLWINQPRVLAAARSPNGTHRIVYSGKTVLLYACSGITCLGRR